MRAHVCIGGPLDGEHAVYKDFYGDGLYAHLGREYFQFNTAYRHSTTLQHPSKSKGLKREECHVVFLHRSLLKPSVTPRNR